MIYHNSFFFASKKILIVKLLIYIVILVLIKHGYHFGPTMNQKRKKRISSTKIVQELKIISNIPAGGELRIPPDDLYRFLEPEIKKRVLEKAKKNQKPKR